MGGAKLQLEEYYAWLEEEELKAQAAYEEAQSRLRLSCTCKEMTRPLTHPLTSRILELASAFGLADQTHAARFGEFNDSVREWVRHVSFHFFACAR